MKGRPKVYQDDTVVRINAISRTKLQEKSDRRAIINYLVEHGGSATLKDIDDHFGFDIRAKVMALVYGGWLEAER
jgi:hypothetical protein